MSPARAPGITLPSTFSPTTSESLNSYVVACLDFLASPLVGSLLECHPNDIAVHGPRPEWLAWWGWAARGEAKWRLLVPGWSCDDEEHAVSEVPLGLRQLLENIDRLTLPRTLDSHFTSPTPNGSLRTRGMSLKKSHEVSQMSALIHSLVSNHDLEIKDVIDVGAGQGYLSRALCEYPLSLDVLALDSSDVQTRGAERRGNNIQKEKAKLSAKNSSNRSVLNPSGGSSLSGADPSTHLPQTRDGTVTHEMIHINPQTLHDSVTHWISSQRLSLPLSPSPTPVVLVALHACGTLTPDILRYFLSYRNQLRYPPQNSAQWSWYPAGLVVVGCCYNLMSPTSDFPLSSTVVNNNQTDGQRLHLSYNHRSLAAQSPLQWTINDSTRASAELAIRKVAYRALFARLSTLSPLTRSIGSDQENRERPGKIGRLRDTAYASLPEFVAQANKKIGTQVSIPTKEETPVLPELISCLEVLHTLRSLIGPVIESLILVDRWLYLVDSLPDLDVRAVNLFDQQLGSARNVALVVSPQKASLPL